MHRRMLFTAMFRSEAIGGTERIILQLASSVQAAGWTVAIAVVEESNNCPFGDAIRSLGIEPAVLPDVLRKTDVRGMRQLVHGIHSLQPTIVHIHLPGALANPFVPFAVRLANVPRMVITEQTNTLLAQRWFGRQRKRLTATLSDQVVAVSCAVRNGLVEFYGVPSDKITVIHNGVEARAIASTCVVAAGVRLRIRYGLPSDSFVIGCTAALRFQKGHTFLLKAMAQILDVQPKAVLLLLGSGELRSELEQEACSLGIQKHVVFAGWQPDVTDHLYGFDLFVLPSLYEGLPLAVLEAMAAARPIVATNVDGTAEAIEHEVTGLLVPARDPAALSNAMLRMIDSPELASRLGVAAQTASVSNYDVEVMVRRYTRLYESLLS